jgi:hypothetical protein
MNAVGPDVNWSDVARRAIEVKLAEIDLESGRRKAWQRTTFIDTANCEELIDSLKSEQK